jgi:hypothetical protein
MYPKAVLVGSYIPEGAVIGVNEENTNIPITVPNLNLLPNVESTKEYLNSKHWPLGYQEFLIKNATRMPYRFFICDDSGSMATNDGKRLLGSRNNIKEVSCTRWVELCESMKFHAGLANALNMPCEFRMLNSASPILIGGPNSNPENLPILESILSESPGGGTPLCRHIRDVIEKVREIEPVLRSAGKRAAIIIATDGEASDGDLVNAMIPLQSLPVWVVVRLCTDDSGVVNYWNSIDEKLEVDIDVIDDMLGEANEVHSVNPWLNYCEPLHRLREFGVFMKDLDMLDERLLSAEQMRSVCALVFNVPVSMIPHPEVDFEGFIQYISTFANDTPKAYSLAKRKYMPLVDVTTLRAMYGPRSSCIIS